MLQIQDHRCAACLEPNPKTIDHDHLTGKVRGLLCYGCNAMAGLAHDDPVMLIVRAHRHREQAALAIKPERAEYLTRMAIRADAVLLYLTHGNPPKLKVTTL